jgi:hypothetical protein
MHPWPDRTPERRRSAALEPPALTGTHDALEFDGRVWAAGGWTNRFGDRDQGHGRTIQPRMDPRDAAFETVDAPAQVADTRANLQLALDPSSPPLVAHGLPPSRLLRHSRSYALNPSLLKTLR